MIQKYSFLLILILSCTPLAGQKQTAMNWYFGSGFGITFTSGSPVLVNGNIMTREGSAAYSDPQTGALMFYTDGAFIWDREHTLMPRSAIPGMSYNPTHSTTQAALIVPHPGDERLFYIFNPGNTTESPSEVWPEFNRLAHNSFSYQLVSMSEREGLGDVIEKKVILPDVTLSEKITGVYHCSNNEYIIITLTEWGNGFYIWRVGKDGLIESPQVIDLGNPNHFHRAGQMKLSPDGTKLALVNHDNSPYSLKIFEFDIQTGSISNPINLDLTLRGPDRSIPVGVSFSPDSRLLYTVGMTIGLEQFNLDTYDSLTILQSRITIDNTPSSYWLGQLQIGPDEKLYIIHDDCFVSVVENPNEYGGAVNLRKEIFELKRDIGNIGAIGAPNFMDYIFGPGIKGSIPIQVSADREMTCPGTGVQLHAQGGKDYVWSPGVLLNDSTIADPIAYPDTTTTFTATSVRGDCIGSAEITITVVAPKPLEIIADTTICEDDSVQLWAAGAETYVWEPAEGLDDNTSATPVAAPQHNTLYRVRATDKIGCKSEDSVWVIVRPRHSITVQFELPDTNAPPGTLIAVPLYLRIAPSELPQIIPRTTITLRYDLFVLDLVDIRGAFIHKTWRDGDDALVEFEFPGRLIRDSLEVFAESEFLTLISTHRTTPIKFERIFFDEELTECALNSEFNNGSYANHEYCLNYNIGYRSILAMNIAPNPVRDYVVVTVQPPDGDNTLLFSCCDAFGREIWHEEFRSKGATPLEVQISTSHWHAGMYMLNVRAGAERLSKKLIIAP